MVCHRLCQDSPDLFPEVECCKWCQEEKESWEHVATLHEPMMPLLMPAEMLSAFLDRYVGHKIVQYWSPAVKMHLIGAGIGQEYNKI